MKGSKKRRGEMRKRNKGQEEKWERRQNQKEIIEMRREKGGQEKNIIRRKILVKRE